MLLNNYDTNNQKYYYFNLIIIFWIVLFCIFFLRNATFRFLIEELKITLVTLSVMTIYMWVIYFVNMASLLKEGTLFEGTTDLGKCKLSSNLFIIPQIIPSLYSK